MIRWLLKHRFGFRPARSPRLIEVSLMPDGSFEPTIARDWDCAIVGHNMKARGVMGVSSSSVHYWGKCSECGHEGEYWKP
jgi:hypothetical protein